MEKLAYELRPYVYFVLSVSAIHLAGGSTWASFFAGVLLSSSLWVFHMRFTYHGLQRLRAAIRAESAASRRDPDSVIRLVQRDPKTPGSRTAA